MTQIPDPLLNAEMAAWAARDKLSSAWRDNALKPYDPIGDWAIFVGCLLALYAIAVIVVLLIDLL